MYQHRRALSLTGWRDAGHAPRPPREALEHAGTLGTPAVVLDLATPGMRPRELDRSARRDVASLLRRLGLSLAGADLWIPPEHFAQALHQERALAATRAAIHLISELVSLGAASAGIASASARAGVLSLALPRPVPTDVREELARTAEDVGVVIADHAWPAHAHGDFLCVGLDPAVLLAAGVVPEEAVLTLNASGLRASGTSASGARGSVLASVRLSDWNGSGRILAGRGRLNIEAYEMALAGAAYAGPLVLDVRDIIVSDDALRSMLQA